MIVLNLFEPLHEVDFLRLPDPGAFQHLPANIQKRADTNHGIREQERGNIPVAGQENGIASHKGHHEASGQAIPGGERLPGSLVRQGIPIHPLSLQGRVPAEVGHAHDTVVDELAGRDEVDEPLQHDGGVVRHLQEAEQGDEQHNHHTVYGHALPGALRQEPRGLAVQSKPEETAAGAIDITVARAESGRQHHGVDNVWQDTDLETVHGHHVGTGGGTRRARGICRL